MRLRAVLLLVSSLLVAGCAATSVFNPYPEQAQAFRQATTGFNSTQTLNTLARKGTSADAQLYLLERARIAQLAGDYAGSRADIDAAIAAWRAADDKARLSLTDTGATGSALLTNDNAIPYVARPHERVMAHLFQAFNYLGLGDVQGAQVELRRAQQLQRELELKYADEVARAQGEAAQNSVMLGDFDENFTGIDAIAGSVKNSFQNGYTFYVAGVIREAIGEYNDALVDYKKAFELSPDNAQLAEDVRRANGYFRGGNAPRAGGDIVVLYEQGFVPAKREAGLAIPTMDGGIFSIAFPVYDAMDYTPPSPLRVRGEGDLRGRTEPLVDTSALAARALREQIPGMLVRQVLRARTKYEMQKQAAKQGGIGAQFLTNIYNLVSERADLRSWLTLPANAQATRLSLPAGTHQLELIGSAGSRSVAVEARPGRTTLVRVVEVNGTLVTQVFPL